MRFLIITFITFSERVCFQVFAPLEDVPQEDVDRILAVSNVVSATYGPQFEGWRQVRCKTVAMEAVRILFPEATEVQWAPQLGSVVGLLPEFILARQEAHNAREIANKAAQKLRQVAEQVRST